MIGQLLDAGMLHEDVQTILGHGLRKFFQEPVIEDGKLAWSAARSESLDTEILRPAGDPFDREGGLRVVDGNLGRAIVKVSAVDVAHHKITAPARVFRSQEDFKDAFNRNELEQDLVAVLPFQGAGSIGMPELHQLTPYLGLLQNRGFNVALLTDGRMSGASGKVLSAIQVSPEAIAGGAIGKIRDGDIIELDSAAGIMEVRAEDDFEKRSMPDFAAELSNFGMGRELFNIFRSNVSSAETGATIFGAK
jgi:phosphogluconate dehydratase